MTEISKELLDKFQCRKSKIEKQCFYEYVRSVFPEAKQEIGGFPENKNIVLGNPEDAKVIWGAHYDTAPALPIPNFLFPKNMVLYFLIWFIAGMALGDVIIFLRLASGNAFISNFVSALAIIALLAIFAYMFLGKSNKHTANDNTSGVAVVLEAYKKLSEEQRKNVAVVLEAYKKLSEEQRKNVAVVLFDNEETGLFGSSFFAKKHREKMKNTLLINFDCVSDGDHIMLVMNKKARKIYGDIIKETFASEGEKKVLCEKSSTVFYPSDQMNFPVNVGVAAFKSSRVFGLYLKRIHTKHDTIFDERNIDILTNSLVELCGKI